MRKVIGGFLALITITSLVSRYIDKKPVTEDIMVEDKVQEIEETRIPILSLNYNENINDKNSFEYVLDLSAIDIVENNNKLEAKTNISKHNEVLKSHMFNSEEEKVFEERVHDTIKIFNDLPANIKRDIWEINENEKKEGRILRVIGFDTIEVKADSLAANATLTVSSNGNGKYWVNGSVNFPTWEHQGASKNEDKIALGTTPELKFEYGEKLGIHWMGGITTTKTNPVQDTSKFLQFSFDERRYTKHASSVAIGTYAKKGTSGEAELVLSYCKPKSSYSVTGGSLGGRNPLTVNWSKTGTTEELQKNLYLKL